MTIFDNVLDGLGLGIGRREATVNQLRTKMDPLKAQLHRQVSEYGELVDHYNTIEGANEPMLVILNKVSVGELTYAEVRVNDVPPAPPLKTTTQTGSGFSDLWLNIQAARQRQSDLDKEIAGLNPVVQKLDASESKVAGMITALNQGLDKEERRFIALIDSLAALPGYQPNFTYKDLKAGGAIEKFQVAQIAAAGQYGNLLFLKQNWVNVQRQHPDITQEEFITDIMPMAPAGLTKESAEALLNDMLKISDPIFTTAGAEGITKNQ